MTGLLTTLERLTKAVAVVTRRPMSYFTAEGTTSGEHMKMMEAGLVSTAEAAQIVFGNAWEDVMKFALRLASEFGTGYAVPVDVSVETTWKDPTTRNEAEHTKSVLDKTAAQVIDVSQALDELGYSGDVKRAILMRREMERIRSMQQAMQLAQSQKPDEKPDEAKAEGESPDQEKSDEEAQKKQDKETENGG